MKKLALLLAALLIPSICFADSLVYVSKTPTVSTVKLQGPQALVAYVIVLEGGSRWTWNA